MNSFKNNGDCCNCTGELTVSDVGDRMGSNHRVSFLLSLSVTERGSASGFSLWVVSEKEGGENEKTYLHVQCFMHIKSISIIMHCVPLPLHTGLTNDYSISK